MGGGSREKGNEEMREGENEGGRGRDRELMMETRVPAMWDHAQQLAISNLEAVSGRSLQTETNLLFLGIQSVAAAVTAVCSTSLNIYFSMRIKGSCA